MMNFYFMVIDAVLLLTFAPFCYIAFVLGGHGCLFVLVLC